MKYFRFSLTLLVVVLLLNIAGSAQNSKSLSSKSWTLTEIDGSKIAAAGIFLDFDESKNLVTGNTGCNNISGRIKISGGNIKLSVVSTTRMFCPQGGTTLLEKQFLRALEQVTGYKKSDTALTFYTGKKIILKFQAATKNVSASNPEPATSPTALPTRNEIYQLEDKKWTFTVAGNDRPGVNGSAYIVFDSANKSASGDSGCSGFGGEYTIDGDKFTFSQTMMTNRMCADEGRQGLSSVFMTALGLANRLTIVDGKLNLYRDDRLLLTLKRADK